MAASGADTTAVVDGVEVALPMVVERATGGLLVVAGDVDAIAAALPHDLAPVRLPAGRGIVLLLSVRYLDNPLGDYDEFVVGLAARPAAQGGGVASIGDVLRGRFGAWIEHMAVDQAFTRRAGEQIWGYPKTLDDLGFTPTAATAAMTWARDGRQILRVQQSTRGALRLPALPFTTYTRLDGRTVATPLHAHVRGAGLRPRTGRVVLGDHPLADQLRSLGVDRRPLAAAWLERMRMRFGAPVPLHGGPT